MDVIFFFTFICCPGSIIFYVCNFRYRKMFSFIHRGGHCTIYSIVPGPTVSSDSLLFYATGKQAIHGDSSSVWAMDCGTKFCHSQCYSFFSSYVSPIPAHYHPHLCATTNSNKFSNVMAPCLLSPLLHTILLTPAKTEICLFIEVISVVKSLICECLSFAFSTLHALSFLVCRWR